MIGKCNVIHFLSQSHGEKAVTTGKTTRFPALDMVLKYKPDLNVYNIHGRTPLLHAVVTRTNHVLITEKLVGYTI